MANTIQIKRGASDGSLIPTTLAVGELAYAENGSKLYIGESGSTITAIGGEVGVTVQGYDAGLNSIAGLTTAADQLLLTTASDTYSAISVTADVKSLLGGADAAAMRTTLGAGTSNLAVGSGAGDALAGNHDASAVTSTKIGNWDNAATWYTNMTSSDADNIINTVNEIITAFESHTEDLTLITELDAKLSSTDTIDGGTF